MDCIRELLSRNNLTAKISVVGDLMLDEYFYVTADRVSPEFPIPVMLSEHGLPLEIVPGGAANVCRQFNHFNTQHQLFGLADTEAIGIYEQYGLNFEGVLLPNKKIPRKKRFYQGQFPLCRLDIEQEKYGLRGSDLEERKDALIERFSKVNRSEVVIFSDYNKGLFGKNCKKWIRAAGDAITIVDPKKGPLEKWAGCSIIKPNAKEAKELTGKINWQDQCQVIHNQTGATGIIITEGGRGVTGMVHGRYFEYRPKTRQEAESVIGAGDCFIATLAICMSHSMDIIDSCEIAFKAGAVYVNKKHNTPVYPTELVEDKFILPDESRDYKLVFTNGCFDILHAGHVDYLRQAKAMGDKLVVAVNSDESVKRLKGEERPVNHVCNRMAVLAGLEFVDFVVEFNEDTPYNLIEQLKPDILVKGSDWKGKIVGSDIVDDVRTVPLLPELSTTIILGKIRGVDET